MDENLKAFNVSENAARKISALLKDEQEADSKYMRVAVEGGAFDASLAGDEGADAAAAEDRSGVIG